MNSIRRSLPVLRQCASRYSSSADKVIEVPGPRAKAIKEMQKRFQIDDGVPVYIKLGVRDKLLYQLTVFGTIISLVWSGKVAWELILKK